MSKKDTTPVEAASKRQPVAVLDELEIGNQEAELAAYLEVDLMAPVGVLKARIRSDAETGLRVLLSMGLRLMALKAATPHGEYEDALNEVGVSPREARRSMQMARAFAAETDVSRREQILHLGKTKGVALLAASPAVRDQILGDPELAEEAAEASRRELENTVKALEGKLKRAQSDLNDAQQINQGLTKKKLKSDLRADTQLVRDECLHQQALVEYGALALKKAWDAVQAEDHTSPEHALRRDQIVHAARAAAVAATQVAREIEEQAEGVALTTAHLLTEAEVSAWAADWETIRAGLRAKDAARFDRLQQDLPRDVGRPKGSGKKGQAEA